jgi:hypothetical protein
MQSRGGLRAHVRIVPGSSAPIRSRQCGDYTTPHEGRFDVWPGMRRPRASRIRARRSVGTGKSAVRP